jgi:hypothetical protein
VSSKWRIHPEEELIMLNTPMTHHAARRLQQRGIPETVLPLLFEFGEEEYDHHGAMMLYFNKRSRERLARVVPKDQYKRLERALNAYAVIDRAGSILTVGHRTHRINHN